MPSIKCVDTVRTAAEMKPADLEGIEGRWVDVPRLQQRSAEVRSNFWCGRASAAMIYNYYCKAQKKTDQYVGHDDGDQAPGLSGAKFNLRFMGGPNKGKLAGVDEAGKCNPAGIFDLAGWKSDSGELSQGQAVSTDPAEVEKRFARHIDQLKKNNPIVQYTQLTRHRGHIVVINGYKKDSDRGELWLRIVDPCYPHNDLLGDGNFQTITSPQAPDQEFSEYWLKARRLLEQYPGRDSRFFAHGDAPTGHFFYAVPDQPVKDDHELVHKVGKGLGETAGKKPGDDPGKGSSPSSGATSSGAGAGSGSGSGAGAAQGPAAACPPVTGVPRLAFSINGGSMVTGAAITSLYHQTERGLGGFFPLGDSGLFHCGAHVTPAANSPIMAMADGEIVAARIGGGPGEHAWGDTGFVLLRHKVKGDKKVYCLYLHLKREPLHPDNTDAGWLKRLLIDAMQDKNAPKKPRWRVMEAQPTWKDADKGKFSPTNVSTDDKLDTGVYEEDAELVQDSKRYVKLKGKWVRALGPDGSGGKVKEMSPWSDFDLDKACKNDPHVKDLKDGKTAVFDDLKSDDGKAHKITTEAGETVGRSGSYLGSPSLHWSVFSRDAVFPSGALGDEEFKADESPKVKDLDLSSKEHGTKEHASALIEALDPKKKWIGSKEMEWIIEPGELRHFYRTPTQCWRGRYQAVKGLADFKLDLDKLVKQDRYKSHTDGEKSDFARNGKAFLFWADLAKAEDFPTDGKAIFVHPVTALRLMSQVRVEQDHDDPPAGAGTDAADRTHAGEDVVLVVRDAKGPLAAVDVTVKADGNVVLTGKTDSQGEIVVKIEDVAGKDVEVSVDSSVVGDKGQLVQVANETAAPPSLTPGDAPGNQKFNGDEVVPNPRLGLRMKVKKGAMVKRYGAWEATRFEASKPIEGFLEPEASVTAERIVFRSDDGKKECISLLQGKDEVFCWSIENGEEKIALDLPADQQKKDPDAMASWSARIAHLRDHPILAGRVQNIDDGAEVEVSWRAMMSVGAPEHDHDLGKAKCKVAAGGFAVAFDPHVLTSDNNLLNAPRPVFAKLKAKGKDLSLRDQAITIYGDAQFPDAKPKPQGEQPAPGQKAKEIVAWIEVDRGTDIDRPTGWGGKEHQRFASRKLTQLTGAVAHRLTAAGVENLWVAPCLPSQHLALESEKEMSPADALLHHAAALKAPFPDAPDWIVAADVAAASKAGNGIQTGICATDCKSSVAPQGRKAGCTEQVRQTNLGSCHNGTDPMCQTAVQLGAKMNTVKKDGCPAVASSCGAAQHDKSHCFLSGVVKGDNAEERERWHVRLPMRTSGAGYPYIRDTGRNARVLLINPASGAAVVCSQEARGPQGKCEGNIAVPEAAVEKDEFKDKDTLLAASYETFWKLGLPRAGGGEAVVLMAFCDVNTPLGPVAPELPIALKKTAPFDELMGDSPPVEPGVPGDKVKSGNIVVGGKHFADWYNQDFWPLHKGRHPTLVYGKDGMHPVEFPGPITKVNFKKVFDHCEPLYAKEITLPEFVAICCIMLNEVGGSFAAIGERNGPKYMFEAGPRKQSYNGILGNKKAGDQLVDEFKCIPEERRAEWNVHDHAVYPDDSGIEAQVRECDFFKFRGHGLNQLTGRGNYDAHMNKFLKQYCGKGMDEMSGAEMEDVIQNKPEVYLASFKSFFMKGGMKAAMDKTNDGEFWKVGKINSGGDQYADLFEWRCKTLLDAMTQATYELR